MQRLIYITDRTRLPADQGLPSVVEGNLQAGLRCIYLREKDVGPGCSINLAQAIDRLCTRFGAQLILPATSPGLLEFPQAGLQATRLSAGVRELRKKWGEQKIIGYSAHTMEEALRAEQDGANFVTLAPVYPTATHPGRKALGVEVLAEAAARLSIPVYALGGITLGNIATVINSGCFGVAGISLFQQGDFFKTTRTILKMLNDR